MFAEQIATNGKETNDPITNNVAYGTPLARYAPMFVRVGVRLSF